MKSLITLTKYLSRTTFVLFIAVAMTGTANSDNLGDEPRVIEITGNDNLRFTVNEIQARPGETIRIIFKVKSSMPADAMSHNLAIMKADTPMDEFIQESMKARKNEYIAPAYKEQVIAATAIIGGGKTSEITFTVPDEPGTYPYVCTFPGHYAAGMAGKLIVREKVKSSE